MLQKCPRSTFPSAGAVFRVTFLKSKMSPKGIFLKKYFHRHSSFRDLLCITAYYLMLCPLGRASPIFPFLTTFPFRTLRLSVAEQRYVLLDYHYSQANTMSMGPRTA